MMKTENWQDLGESGLQFRSYRATWRDKARSRLYKLKRPLRFARMVFWEWRVDSLRQRIRVAWLCSSR